MTPIDYEIYQPWIRAFEIITNILTISTLIASIISAKIIVTKTSNILKIYRLLLIALIIAQQINSLHFLFFKTIYLIPTDAFIVRTTIFVSGPFLAILCPVMELMMIVIIADILLCMFVERYYAMTSGIANNENEKISAKLIFFGIGFTNFLLFITYMIALLIGGHLYSPEKSQEFINVNFYNFNATNFGVSTVFSSLSWYTVAFLMVVGIFISTRIFGYLFYTHRIITYLNMLKFQNQLYSQKHTINAVKTLIIQLFTLIVFGCAPVTVTLGFYIFKPSTFRIEICLQIIYHFYFLIDMICIVLLIRPYRRALLQLICKGSKMTDNFIRSSAAVVSIS